MSKQIHTITASEEAALLKDFYQANGDIAFGYRHHRNLTCLLLMLDAGLRVGEVCKLQRSDICFNGLVAEGVKVRALISKNKQERSVPLSGRLRVCLTGLTEYWQHSQGNESWPVIATHQYDSAQITTRQVQRWLKDFSLQQTGRAVNPHSLRHTFATKLMRVLNIRGVQELLAISGSPPQ